MNQQRVGVNPDELIVVTGAGGFIGGSLVRYFADRGHKRLRAVDKKPRWWYSAHGRCGEPVARLQQGRRL